RKYIPHTTAHAKLMDPSTTNDPRQVTTAINQATKGGVNELPRRALECVIPCANARLLSGTQSAIALVAVGKVAPSPNPSITRANSIPPRLPTIPVARVATAQMTADRLSARRAPNRSPNHPPII